MKVNAKKKEKKEKKRVIKHKSMVGFGHLNLPGLEKNQSTMAQRNSTKGITCTAFSANLARAFSFLANSTMGS